MLGSQKLRQRSTSNFYPQSSSKTQIKPVSSIAKLPISETRIPLKPVIHSGVTAHSRLPIYSFHRPNHIITSPSKQNPSRYEQAARNVLQRPVPGKQLPRELLKIGGNSNRPNTVVVSNTLFYDSVKPFLNDKKLRQTLTSNLHSKYASKTPINPVRSIAKLPASQNRFLSKPVIGNAGSAHPSPIHSLYRPNHTVSSPSKQKLSINGKAARNVLSKPVHSKQLMNSKIDGNSNNRPIVVALVSKNSKNPEDFVKQPTIENDNAIISHENGTSLATYQPLREITLFLTPPPTSTYFDTALFTYDTSTKPPIFFESKTSNTAFSSSPVATTVIMQSSYSNVKIIAPFLHNNSTPIVNK